MSRRSAEERRLPDFCVDGGERVVGIDHDEVIRRSGPENPLTNLGELRLSKRGRPVLRELPERVFEMADERLVADAERTGDTRRPALVWPSRRQAAADENARITACAGINRNPANVSARNSFG